MQLSPLQSRLAASLLASFLLILLYLTLFSPQFALAEEIAGDHHNQPLAARTPILDDHGEEPEEAGRLRPRAAVAAAAVSAVDYEPEFTPFDRSIIGRAPPDGVTTLANNVPVAMDIAPGKSQAFVFEKATIFGGAADDRQELRRRDLGEHEPKPESEEDTGAGTGDGESLRRRQAVTTKTVYISANTCLQPQPVAVVADTTSTAQAPQLTMFISTAYDGAPWAWSIFTEGAAMLNVSSSDDLYIRVAAPIIDTSELQGTWNFEVAASIDASYHGYNDAQPPGADSGRLVFVDSDDQAALLQTRAMAPAAADVQTGSSSDGSSTTATQPYVLFAHGSNDRAISGVRYSYCGLQNYARIATTTKDGKLSNLVQSRMMTKRGPDSSAEQQFHISGLNASSTYTGILATTPKRSNAVGGGGIVFRSTDFTTRQSDGNTCTLISGLPFCNTIAYSVPSNPLKLNTTQLVSFYDDYAREMYANFEKALAQIQCETSPTQRYSLVRGCNDCREAYKLWLCHVTIPRCSPFFSNSSTQPQPWLQPRAMSQPFPQDGRVLTDAERDAAAKAATDSQIEASANASLSSRNPRIDEVIAPGPYKELLPCDNLCYDLVQSCPSAMGFACPTPGMRHSFRGSYHVNETDGNGGFKCNFPATGHYTLLLSAGTRSRGAAPPGGWRVFGGGVGAVVLAALVV